jgi:hypothetical protein
MYTVSVSGLGGRTVMAEASLSKLVLTSAGGSKHAKTAVWHAYMGGSSYNWGIDGAPLRWLSNCGYMTFALEVAGSSTYAWMTCRVYLY